ncbi:hypothetical protein HOI71_06125 [Candidatus Poribacteria bacterium]|nr:hypothetical protein [Candidatus Poribacteria bacterium]
MGRPKSSWPGGCRMDRRTFLTGALGGLAALHVRPRGALAQPRIPGYDGPNVIIVRFGGGCRRQETILTDDTYSPYLRHVLAERGTLFSGMEMSESDDVETGHGQGTLNVLTGRYDRYKDVEDRFLGERFEAQTPTVFELLRKSYAVPEHQTLIVNGEDRIDEEFYTFSNHHLFGVEYRSRVLSLYRYKTYLLRQQLAEGSIADDDLPKAEKELAKMEGSDYRTEGAYVESPEIVGFWEKWRAYYGDTGFVNPRGDRLLTELSVRAMRELRPKLMMVNYNDCDYVHWGNMSHYTRGVAIMDEGLRRLVEAADAEDAYRDNTVFVVVPDCGRDDNPFMAVPCQHHANTRSAREIFALIVGPGIAPGVWIDDTTDQIAVAPTVAALMGVGAPDAEGTALEQAFA